MRLGSVASALTTHYSASMNKVLAFFGTLLVAILSAWIIFIVWVVF